MFNVAQYMRDIYKINEHFRVRFDANGFCYELNELKGHNIAALILEGKLDELGCINGNIQFFLSKLDTDQIFKLTLALVIQIQLGAIHEYEYITSSN